MTEFVLRGAAAVGKIKAKKPLSARMGRSFDISLASQKTCLIPTILRAEIPDTYSVSPILPEEETLCGGTQHSFKP